MSSTQWGQWWAKPFACRRGVRVLISVSAIGLVFAVGCMAFLAARRWASTDWGTVPAWVSAVGSLATCVSVGIAAVTYLRAQEDRRRAERDRREDRAAAREDQATQARLVRLSALARGGLDDEGRQRWKVMLRNDSDRPVFGVRIHTLCAVATEGASAAPMRSITTIPEGRLFAGTVLDDIPMRRKMAANGGEFETLWTAVDSYEKPVAKGVNIIHYSLTDANGRTWQIKDFTEPQRIERPDAPAAADSGVRE